MVNRWISRDVSQKSQPSGPSRRGGFRLVGAVLFAACAVANVAIAAPEADARPYSIDGPKDPGGKITGALVAVAEAAADDQVLTHGRAQVDSQDRVQVYFYVSDVSATAEAALTSLGATIEITDEEIGVIQAWVPRSALEALSDLAFVDRIDLPRYGTTQQQGRVGTEGETILRADQLGALGINGRGVRVGVISDGVVNRAQAAATGDLPANITIVGSAGAGNEGTAMLEIIHDLAPEAQLGFCGGFATPTTLAFRQCVRDLTEVFGADIIVDDLGFFGEPYFEDGPVANQVRASTRAGVLYTSAAGNCAETHHEAAFRGTREAGLTIVGRPVSEHNFGLAAGGGSDPSLSLEVPAFGSIRVILQWDDPFGASSNDYDLLVFNVLGAAIAASIETQDGDDDPIEAVVISNPFPIPRPVDIFVGKFSGAAKRIELFVLDLPGVMEHNIPAGSIFGHPAVPNVVAAAAIDASDPGSDDVNGFSSRGPSRIVFPQRADRAKPNLAAIDGVLITGAGGFGAPVTGGARFSGTSAAAPHVAGVAALLASFAPGADAATIRRAMEQGAVDIGAPGRDGTSGVGRLDAVGAAQALNQPPDGVIQSPASEIQIRKGQSVAFSGTATDPENLAMTYVWDFGGGAQNEVLPNTGDISFNQAGTYTVTFRVTDALGATDPTPPTTTVRVTSSGGGGGGCAVTDAPASAVAGLLPILGLAFLVGRRARRSAITGPCS